MHSQPHARRSGPRFLPAALVAVLLALVAAREAPAAQEALAEGTLTDREREIVAAVEARSEEAIAFLERVVNVNSGTMNHAGVREVGALFRQELDALGFETRWIDLSEVDRSGHLFAERAGVGPHLLLIGHLDTVFEEDSPFQTFEAAGDGRARGPGVVDMKGGNVALLYALRALHEAGALDGLALTVALTGDEEDPGLPLEISRGDLIEAGRRADAALGFEGASGTGDEAVIARRGSSGWTLRVEGVEGHSSRVFSEEYGSGAIFEAARILHAFHEEVRGEEYLTFNPGIILGGTEVEYDRQEHRGRAFGKTNVIARAVVVDGGLRFLTEEQKEAARDRMRETVARHLPRTRAEIRFADKYPAMPPTEGNRALLDVLDGASRDLGLGAVGAVDPGARGAADISFVAPYVDGLDGLGPVGSGSHTESETVELASVEAAAKRAALLLHRLGTGEMARMRRKMQEREGATSAAANQGIWETR